MKAHKNSLQMKEQISNLNKIITIIIIIIITCLFPFTGYSQVGINTNTPQSTLDVNGRLQIRGAFKVGGTDNISGDPGTKDLTILASGGQGNPPYWKKAPIVTANFGITESVVLSDKKGIHYKNPKTKTDMKELIEFSNLEDDPEWIVIPGLTSQVTPKYKNNKLVVSFQSIIQTASISESPDVVVAIGVFIDNQLRSTRSVQMMVGGMGFQAVELFDVFNDLPVKADGSSSEIKIAGKLRYLDYPLDKPEPVYDRDITIGTHDQVSDNTNEFMNQSSLKIDLYEDSNSKL